MLIAIDAVLDKQEVAEFRAVLEDAPWAAGAATAGSIARRIKTNEQLDDDSPAARALGERVLQKLRRHPLFISAALPNRIYPPKFNRYAGGGAYGAHVDSALMQLPRGEGALRSDLSATLFLCEPDEYDGGELEIEGAFGVQSVKLAAGDMILYPSSSLHRVTSVSRGARLASFFWIESYVADEQARTLLFDLDQSIQGLTATVGADNADLLKLTAIYHNLLRRSAI